MKTILLALTIFCFVNLTYAQAGKLDSSFGNNGIIKTDLGDSYTPGKPGVKQIVSLSDGSIYVLEGGISKRRANGSIDSSFGTNGYIANDIALRQMAIESDGKIVGGYNGGLVRYNSDGSLDSSFSVNVNSEYNYFQALAIGKDGKIIRVGFDGTSGFYYLSRYNTDGSPDTAFSGDGNVAVNLDSIPYSVFIRTAVIQLDGKIVLAGERRVGFDDHLAFAVLCYNTDGSLDSSFSGDGIQTTEFGREHADIYAAAIQSDGKIVVAGVVSSYPPDFALARYNTNGSLDKSFSGDGILRTNYSTSYGGQSLAFQPDGKIVASTSRAIVRFNTDGSTDGTIVKDSKFYINSIALLSDGKILAGGETTADGFYGFYLALARFNSDGNFDNTFIGNGLLTDIARAGNTGYRKTAVQKDGKIVATGSYWNGKNFDFAIARYNTDGSADNTFNGDGIQITDFASDDDNAKAVAIQEDGKIVVGGANAIARYNADGSLDKSFSGDGKTTGDSVDITSIAIQNDGKIVVAGGDALARFNTDGSLDKMFGAEGQHSVVGTITSLAVQNDQKIVIAVNVNYHYYHDKGEEGFYDSIFLFRLKTNGSLDTAYNHNGKKFFAGDATSGTDDKGSCIITKQNDDKIVVAATVWRNFITGRINTDGSTDSSYKGINYPIYNGYTNYLVSAMALQSDGKMVVMISNGTLYRFTADGHYDSTFNSTGRQLPPFTIHDLIIADNKLYAAGGDQYGTVARYLLDSNSNTPPTVSLTAPSDNATYIAPVNLQLAATAADANGTISKVEFYSGSNLLYTDSTAPYNFIWKNTPAGNYTLTAKATDNSGLTATSAPVHVVVVPNKAPIVSITNPVNNRAFAAPAYIHFEAAASDIDGRITRVEFYSGSTLLATEYKPPYKFVWKNLPVGTYTVTAVATDNWGAQTMSAPVTVKVKAFSQSIVSSKPVAETNDFNAKTEISLKAWPNPANKTLTISMNGLKQNRPTMISILSPTGVVLKTMRINNSTTQLDVSSLTSGVYTIKLLCEDKVLYKQFVKL